MAISTNKHRGIMITRLPDYHASGILKLDNLTLQNFHALHYCSCGSRAKPVIQRKLKTGLHALNPNHTY